jgi:two-component system cell cycle sensor histidine kinase/response regulator CckA
MESNDDKLASPLHATVRVAVRLGHNLRNLLMIMGRCIDSIRGEVPSRSPIERDLAELDRSIDRAFHLTHQLLSIGYPAPRERVVIDINQLVTNAEGMIRRALAENISPRYRLAAERPHVLADPYELEWVLLNLVMNSREAMPQGGQIRIETADHVVTVGDSGHAVVRLTVADTSEKPPAAPVDDKVMRPWDDTDITAIRFANVGILVDNLNGWLEVKHHAGAGTTVHVDLPVVHGGRQVPARP